MQCQSALPFWDTAISKFDRENPWSRSCVWSKFKVTFDLQNSKFKVQYIPRSMHTVLALLCFVVVIHWLIYPYPSGFLHWYCSNLKIVPVPVKQPWWIWVNSSYEFNINDYITTTKQSTTKPCAYFVGYTVMVKIKPIGNIWGLEFNRYVCFSFHGNQTIFGWDIANSIFDLENSRSGSLPRSNPMVTFEP